jgi:hypothetical protein
MRYLSFSMFFLGAIGLIALIIVMMIKAFKNQKIFSVALVFMVIMFLAIGVSGAVMAFNIKSDNSNTNDVKSVNTTSTLSNQTDAIKQNTIIINEITKLDVEQVKAIKEIVNSKTITTDIINKLESINTQQKELYTKYENIENLPSYFRQQEMSALYKKRTELDSEFISAIKSKKLDNDTKNKIAQISQERMKVNSDINELLSKVTEDANNDTKNIKSDISK